MVARDYERPRPFALTCLAFATFRTWFLKTAGGAETELARLVSPIGGDTVKDKRPTVIAALAAAEMMTALALHRSGAREEVAEAGR